MERDVFMADIENMVSDLVKTYHEVSGDQKEMFSKKQTVLGKCPKCKSEVKIGKYGPYCSGKCGMHFGKIMGHALTEKELVTLLEGKNIFVKGLKGNSGKAFDATLTPTGTEEYRFQDEEGKAHEGSRFTFALSFPKKKADRKKKKEK